jgi:tetratricopeptide (TPR) repeat protein
VTFAIFAIFVLGTSRTMKGMSETVVRAAGLGITIVYATLIGWLFVRQPATFAEVTGGLSSAVGAYRIDRQAFEDGLTYFRNDQFDEARAAFDRADPARRDALTQFYIAYAFYREGWGRFYSDDELYRRGLEAVNRAIALAPNGRLVVEEPGQEIRTADELKAELERGLEVETSDFNPARVIRPRK